MKTLRTEVLVVGAGPVGMAAALFLRKRGIDVEVVEAEPRGGSHSYALGLHAATLDILSKEGAGDALGERALGLEGLDLYCKDQRILQLPAKRQAQDPCFFSAIGQNELEDCFEGELKKHGVKVHWNHRLASFTQTEEGVHAEVHEIEERMMGYAAARLDRVVARKLRVECAYVLAADGHHSLVRRQLRIDFPEVAHPEHYAVFEFSSDYADKTRSAQIFEDAHMSVFWPLPDDLVRWSFQVKPNDRDIWSREKDRNLVQVLGLRAYPALNESLAHTLLKQRAPWFNGSVESLHWRMLVRFEKRLATSFGEGRVWLAGDAGHMTYPGGVQSMNVGIRESLDLAVLLSKVLRDGGSPDLFQTYETERQQEWRFLLGLNGPLPVRENAHPCLRENARRLVSALPASGEALLKFLETA